MQCSRPQTPFCCASCSPQHRSMMFSSANSWSGLLSSLSILLPPLSMFPALFPFLFTHRQSEILASCPDVIAPFFAKSPFALEPRLSTRWYPLSKPLLTQGWPTSPSSWVSCVEPRPLPMLRALSLPLQPCNNPHHHRPLFTLGFSPPDTHRVDTILPVCVSRSVLGPALLHARPLVRHAALLLTVAALSRAAAALAVSVMFTFLAHAICSSLGTQVDFSLSDFPLCRAGPPWRRC